MSTTKTLIKLQYNHISYILIVLWNLVRVIGQNLYEDARFIAIVVDGNNPVINEVVELPTHAVKVNNYHMRYEA